MPSIFITIGLVPSILFIFYTPSNHPVYYIVFMNIKFSNKARRQFNRIDEATKPQVVSDMRNLNKDPPEGDIKKLTGRLTGYRLRSGDYRIFFDIKNNYVVIKQILTRGQAYKHRRK